ncbi:uncharacterized protein BCR38DRAFT_460295 [Pseudomassariella vexata]|uniref:LIM zinc-binding domain-containing protein n=1 Tax=Pseudomassariella vexata TaxID=1141098 RepID=A0A1Y2DK67_9PEZI|nr:uncharacterized protein BCR38DRAFT_460295 [Pseudomassariella vexata]ORY59622.1 hypothetical protein BCR38DRAFT_460295 [Pseudomassariella vexata]
MAGLPRESTFMPTIKCSQCGNEVEISMMGDHICGGAPALPEEATPPPDVLGGAFASLKSTVFGFGSKATPPPSVDTSAANLAFKDQLTPVSASTGSRTISPKTPTGRTSTGPSGGDFFVPAIAQSTPPPQGGRPGGYGGFGDPQPYEAEPMYGYSSSPQKAAPLAPNVLQRMNSIAPGPFEINRRAGQKGTKNAFAPPADTLTPNLDDGSRNGYGMERPGTSSSNSGMAPPRAPRKNGYGGFGPPQREQETEFDPRPLPATQRAETFPKQNPRDFSDAPLRIPSESGLRPERPQRSNSEYSIEQPIMTADRQQRPSFGMRDTSRPPPPRKSLIRPPTREQTLSVNLADEFGMGNPYHSPSVSQSSSKSGYSQLSQPSVPSSNTSPARSTASRRMPSDAAKFDGIMDDLSSSMGSLNPRDIPPARPQPPPMDSRPSSRSSSRHPPPDNLRFDPAIQGGPPPPRMRSPLASPIDGAFASRRDPAIQGPPIDAGRSRSPVGRPHNRNQSVGRPRGNCKACKLPITGKSISSADGRLTGRYHKACFVCTTCQEPFSSSTFYVLDDKPYCEQHYHKLNGSLCGTCHIGIEGRFLEDEANTKYHLTCFKCADCGRILSDGYFEVNGRAYCERDAFRRVQQPMMNMPPGRGGRGGLKPPQNGRPFGLPQGGRLAPSGLRPRMERRMTRLGMM